MSDGRFQGVDRAAIWATARRLGRFGYAHLSAEAGVGMRSVQALVRDWVKRKLVEADGELGRQRMFRIVASAPEALPAAAIGSPRQNMWRAMQLNRGFSPTDLAALATTDTVSVSVEDASAWCQTLARAGYLKILRKAKPPIKEAVYQLIANTGPRPPEVRRVAVVIDGNTGRVMHMAGGLKGGSHAAQG